MMAVPSKKMIWSDRDTATLLELSIERKIFEKFDGKKLTTKRVWSSDKWNAHQCFTCGL